MLTSDLVRVRRRGSELTVTELGPRNRPLALEAAEHYLACARAHVGRSRGDWEEACAGLAQPARAKKLADGVRKLVEDRCTFSMDEGADPSALRLELFALASIRRSALAPGEILDRDAVLAEFTADGRATAAPLNDTSPPAPSAAASAAAPPLTPTDLDARLYADLRSAQILQSVDDLHHEELVAHYELSQAQAVLLRATRVSVILHRADPAALRALFRQLKFLRLLHVVLPLKDGEHRVDLDGPLALFGPSTKYGLSLALLVPALERTGSYTLRADVLWGASRDRCTFLHQGGGALSGPVDTTLPDEVLALQERLKALDAGWTVRANTRVLDLPGVGLCVPDLVCKRDGATVYVEVLGYWSRPAVWRRVELVEQGLRERILFCVSSRLRVSEEALPDTLPGSLYVYKGALSAKQVLGRVEALAAR